LTTGPASKTDLIKCGVELSDEVTQKTDLYLEFILKWRKRINLTSVSSREELFKFHILEGFWAAEKFRSELNAFVDIGSGAGFPGMAIKIYLPDSKVTLIEPNLKRVVFLQAVASNLGLDLEVFHGRAEDFPDWNLFQTAVLRALKPSEQTLNRLKENNYCLLVFRGQNNPVDDPEWTILKEERFPLSRNRFVSVLGRKWTD
jgi:16S rRNA (guanine527-N7)-methyltransferase